MKVGIPKFGILAPPLDDPQPQTACIVTICNARPNHTDSKQTIRNFELRTAQAETLFLSQQKGNAPKFLAKR